MMKMSYGRFAAVLAASLVLMFILSQAMSARWAHLQILNLSNFYMAMMMVSSMAVIMLVGMWHMFPNQRMNAVVAAAAVVVFIGSFSMGRASTFVGDDAFMRSMIPHHSRAILICQQANLTDPDVIDLCRRIIESQREEIAEMETLLQR